MILEILAATLSIATLNQAKPATTHVYKSYTPEAIEATSDRAQEIILNSYYLDMPWQKLITLWDEYDQPNTTAALYLSFSNGSGQLTNTNYYYNNVYLLIGGAKINGDTELKYYICNAYGIYTNDAEHYEICLDQNDYDDIVNEQEEDAPNGLWLDIGSFNDGYGFFGILIPKPIDTTYDRCQLSLFGNLITIYSKYFRTDANPIGWNNNYPLEEPQAIRLNEYTPFKKTSVMNYLTDDLGVYTKVDDNLSTGPGSTADDTCYYYDKLFQNSSFINKYVGVKNMAVNIMETATNNDYKYLGLYVGYNVNISTYADAYEYFNNKFYNNAGFGTTASYDMRINKRVYISGNDEINMNTNTWLGENADTFIVLQPSKTINTITQMEILKSHTKSYIQITGQTTSGTITINGDITDVFYLISMAFAGLGGFMTIAILPGITLGTLFLLPLITGLLIWLINLFKRH